MTVDEKGHPQDLMAEIARVVREWAHGPMLSETALSEIRAITAYEAAKTAEGAVARATISMHEGRRQTVLGEIGTPAGEGLGNLPPGEYDLFLCPPQAP